jgi:hypothetical protein
MFRPAWIALLVTLNAAGLSAQPAAPAPAPAPGTAPTTSAAPAATAPAATLPAVTSPVTTAPATTAPATTAAVQDLSTPKSAVRSLAVAMQSGDKDALLNVLHANTPVEARLASVMAELAEAMAGLSQSAVTAFGEEGARPFTRETADSVEAIERLDSATVTEQGDSAIVGADGVDPGVTLVRVDGKWKFPVAALIAGVDEAAITQRLADVEAQVGLFTEAADEVKQGKYKTGEEVRQALDQRILQMVMQRPRPTSVPAKQP